MAGAGRRRNAIGARGETIFQSVLTKFHGKLPLFRVSFLDGKWPMIDFVVELEGTWSTRRPFFLVQVKTTTQGYTPDDRLKVSIPRKKATALRAYRVPAYIAGVDLHSEEVFVAAALGPKVGALSNLGTSGLLDAQGRKRLWLEVRDYWSSVPFPSYPSNFIEPDWKP